MESAQQDLLKQTLIVILSLKRDAGLNLNGLVSDVRRETGEGGKYRHICPENAEELCELVENTVKNHWLR